MTIIFDDALPGPAFPPSPVWTDKRIELVKKFWAKGWSARQIAAELCCGITRNAVIGKVHRLGLSGRAKSSPPFGPKINPNPRPYKKRASKRLMDERGVMNNGPATAEQLDVARAVYEDANEVMESYRSALVCSIDELSVDTCRWPLGDPSTPDFRYCGERPLTSLPYCGSHSRMAYNGMSAGMTRTEQQQQQIEGRRRERAAILKKLAAAEAA